MHKLAQTIFYNTRIILYIFNFNMKNRLLITLGLISSLSFAQHLSLRSSVYDFNNRTKNINKLENYTTDENFEYLKLGLGLEYVTKDNYLINVEFVFDRRKNITHSESIQNSISSHTTLNPDQINHGFSIMAGKQYPIRNTKHLYFVSSFKTGYFNQKKFKSIIIEDHANFTPSNFKKIESHSLYANTRILNLGLNVGITKIVFNRVKLNAFLDFDMVYRYTNGTEGLMRYYYSDNVTIPNDVVDQTYNANETQMYLNRINFGFSIAVILWHSPYMFK